MAEVIRLKAELRQKHWQPHTAFCREYDRAARAIDPDLVGTAPSRAQFHRWLSGDLVSLPYPHHCRVLEKMFPGLTAAQLFEPCTVRNREPVPDAATSAAAEPGSFSKLVASRIDRPLVSSIEWGPFDSGQSAPGPTVSSPSESTGVAIATRKITQALTQLANSGQFESRFVNQLAHLAGNIVELDSGIDIQIDSTGSARLTFHHELINLTTRPLTRIAQELWFEYTDGKLNIAPVRRPERRVAIQRIHDTAHLSKFACQFSPPVPPGETVVAEYVCEGGRFVDAFYWRRSIHRYTRRFGMTVRHCGVGDLASCTAVEAHQDGSENSATDSLIWDCEGNDVVIGLTREFLRPNQSVTLRWECA